jgi:hypothetical protein
MEDTSSAPQARINDRTSGTVSSLNRGVVITTPQLYIPTIDSGKRISSTNPGVFGDFVFTARRHNAKAIYCRKTIVPTTRDTATTTDDSHQYTTKTRAPQAALGAAQLLPLPTSAQIGCLPHRTYLPIAHASRSDEGTARPRVEGRWHA